MKPLSPAAMRVMADNARQLGALAPAVADTFERLASDPAMSAISSNPEITWLTSEDTDRIAAFTAAATSFVHAVIDCDKAARKAKRREGLASILFPRKDR